MASVVDALQANAWVLALLAVLLAVVALAVVVMRSAGADRDETPRQPGIAADADLDRLLASQMQRLDLVADELRGQSQRLRALEVDARHMVQRMGLVRFNPFEDTGGNQSFVLALLDGDANGVILTSLHSRQATRVYVKAIVAGRCEAGLSAEESEALRQTGLAASG